MTTRWKRWLAIGAWLALGADGAAFSQVHYFGDGRPWNQRARKGPDAVVPGWYYNLGITGIRVELTEERPKHLRVRYVFEGSPAAGKVQVGDWIVGAGGAAFETPHRNGYGMDKFGAHGPIADFARVLERGLERALGSESARLPLRIERVASKSEPSEPSAPAESPELETIEVVLDLGKPDPAFSPTFPTDCRRSDRVLEELLAFLESTQRDDGSWGSPPHDTFAPLAFLATGEKKYLPIVEKSVRYHARTTKSVDESWLINWRYMAAAIVMSEYFLATGEEWVVPELQEVYDFIHSSQYVDLAQVSEKTKKERTHDLPKDALDSHGGWGHNPGFEGYGPICMLTGQGALAFSLMARCGIEIDRARHDAAYAFLKRGTGPNGYTWYEDTVGNPKGWADMGRTGAAGIANWLSPYPEPEYRERALEHARVIGKHPESFPDTHGSPVMGMGFAAVAAWADPSSFRKLMDANRWWFTLAQCPDGSFYYQPNRDNAGYGDDSRVSASAVTAFVLTIPKRGLVMTGRPSKPAEADSEKK